MTAPRLLERKKFSISWFACSALSSLYLTTDWEKRARPQNLGKKGQLLVLGLNGKMAFEPRKRPINTGSKPLRQASASVHRPNLPITNYCCSAASGRGIECHFKRAPALEPGWWARRQSAGDTPSQVVKNSRKRFRLTKPTATPTAWIGREVSSSNSCALRILSSLWHL